MVTRILDSVENAAASKPKIDRFITRFAKVYTPCVVGIAVATALIPSLVTGNWHYWIYTAITFLVMSCPCAVVLSVPLAFFCGIGAGSKRGILFKGGVAIEALKNVKAVVMDKTGTITIGNRKATKFYAAPGVDERDFIEACLLSSISDETPEGKSIIELGRETGRRMRDLNTTGARMIKFTAETKCSGVDLQNGTQIRKGAFDAIRKIAESAGNSFPKEVEDVIAAISSNGGTPVSYTHLTLPTT